MNIGIVGGGPFANLPDLKQLEIDISLWIGTDRGALYLIKQGIAPDIALGDFDSVNESEKKQIKNHTKYFIEYPVEKDETDLDLAILEGIKRDPKQIYLFGVTGGRLDHELANIQLLYKLKIKKVKAILMDKGNYIELFEPGTHMIERDNNYSNISFLPLSEKVTGITLSGFYYKLTNATISWGSTLCLSNKLISEKGTFSFDTGILIVIKSRDVLLSN